MKPKSAPETFAGVSAPGGFSTEARKVLENLDAAATHSMLAPKCPGCSRTSAPFAHCRGADLDCLCVCTETEKERNGK